jgi:cytochrome c553
MKSNVRGVVIGVACFALGAIADRSLDVMRVPHVPPAQAPQSADAPIPAGSGGTAVPLERFETAPLWAYGYDKPPAPGEKAAPQPPPTRSLRPNEPADEQTRPQHVEGSTAAFSLVDIRDQQNVIDWFPGDHPPMPAVVAHGPSRMGTLARGCAACHLPNGRGRPENAPAAALPATYILRQLSDFRNGLRRTADPRKPNTNTMIDLARGMTDEEMKASAAYFSSAKWAPWVRVVETNMVPKTKIVANLFIPIEQGMSEPIGDRIIEVPEKETQSELYRNPRSGFVAYVPVGSIKRGEDLVVTGGMRIVDNKIVQGKTTPCGTCHGPDLLGVADVPPIAGRSPSYLVRQLWDIQQGTRNGASVQLMKLIVANLTAEDMINMAAYVASRPTSGAPAASGQLTAVVVH